MSFFGKKSDNSFLGYWTTDGVTVYEFYEGDKDAMKVPQSTYEFTYTVNDNKVLINFANESLRDFEYEYFFEGNSMKLVGENGTFVFKKNE